MTPFLTPSRAQLADTSGNHQLRNRSTKGDSETFSNTWKRSSADSGSREGRRFGFAAVGLSRAAKWGVLAAHTKRRPGIFDHAVGEGKEHAAPAAREPPRSAVGARHVPVALAPWTPRGHGKPRPSGEGWRKKACACAGVTLEGEFVSRHVRLAEGSAIT